VRELVRSAFVIARRDFTATVLSRTFLLFLLGPFFPLLIVVIFGAATAPMSVSEQPTVAVISTPEEFRELSQARDRLQDTFGALAMVNLEHVAPTGEPQQGARFLLTGKPGVIAVLEGGLEKPRVLGTIRTQSGTAKQLRLFIAEARRSAGNETSEAVHMPVMQTSTAVPAQNVGARAITSRAGQSLLFLLTLLLAGMLLSQLIEEKSNKVIEVLAAAVPVDAIFLGKLLAMLAASLAGIAVWSAVAVGALAAFAPAGLDALPPPAVGWPVFILLGVLYFAMSYLLLGAIFLGIGAHASSAREVQTLSMPVTMAQVVIFALASVAVGAPDNNRTIAAAVFPLSSPYVMIARAAEVPDVMPHLFALLWQLLWVALFLRVASNIFRKSVLKSGPVRLKQRKPAKA
jgi:ABC-2 type transport system permease protein